MKKKNTLKNKDARDEKLMISVPCVSPLLNKLKSFSFSISFPFLIVIQGHLNLYDSLSSLLFCIKFYINNISFSG